jgi:hypothetical protein
MPKDYTYRSKWKHKFSRAYNKAKRGGMTKKEMMSEKGRFPRKDEWWGPGNEKDWKIQYVKNNPKPQN